MTGPDFRGDKMESSEGQGLARRTFLRWWHDFPLDFRQVFGDRHGHSALEVDLDDPDSDIPPSRMWEEVSDAALEESELIGFWIAWHRAGGFRGLEMAGWNRATIYRKLKRFRLHFEAHPDEHRFSWIELDLDTCWMNDLGFEFNDETKSWVYR